VKGVRSSRGVAGEAQPRPERGHKASPRSRHVGRPGRTPRLVVRVNGTESEEDGKEQIMRLLVLLVLFKPMLQRVYLSNQK
jgi:hypothetical protein